VDLSNLERMVEELGQRLNIKLEHNHGSASDISKPSRQLSNQERKMYDLLHEFFVAHIFVSFYGDQIYSSWGIFLTGNIREMLMFLPHHKPKGQ
jgi:hypothetical protein